MKFVVESRMLSKIHQWSKRKRRSWSCNVLKLLNDLSAVNSYESGISKELFMREVKQKIRLLDEQLWFTKLWTDGSNLNGNKLRVYRQY